MAFEHYIRSGQKLLRCGYTTGTCAALAAAGAAQLLLTGHAPEHVALQTPKGLWVAVEPEFCRPCGAGAAECGVAKDAGDDIDVTDGLVIVATVRHSQVPGITIDGGAGVGRVTRLGLDQPVGAAAINRVPRQMIQQQVLAVCERTGYTDGLAVTLSVPGGTEAAKRTFNPQLGVQGGISILGTSGIVEPMSEQALVDTIAVELRQAAVTGSSRLILTPGNYGADFLRAQGLDALGIPVVKCSNFIGDALDIAAGLPFKQVLLAGHIGKLVKLAGGVMNTHSKYADCRTELFCAHAAVCGADSNTCRALLRAATSDACLALLDSVQLRKPVMDSLLTEIQHHLDRRAGGAYQIGAVVFSNQYGLLGRTDTAEEMIKVWNR